jgi:hypothetical protein
MHPTPCSINIRDGGRTISPDEHVSGRALEILRARCIFILVLVLTQYCSTPLVNAQPGGAVEIRFLNRLGSYTDSDYYRHLHRFVEDRDLQDACSTADARIGCIKHETGLEIVVVAGAVIGLSFVVKLVYEYWRAHERTLLYHGRSLRNMHYQDTFLSIRCRGSQSICFGPDVTKDTLSKILGACLN